MTRINVPLGDGTTGWFDRDRAEMVEGRRKFDGQNMADVHVGANRGQDLYRTRSGRFVLFTWSAWVNESDTYAFIGEEQARDWLMRNESDKIAQEWFGEIEEERGPGRPEVGDRFQLRLPPDLRARVEARAQDGESLAATVRRLLEDATS